MRTVIETPSFQKQAGAIWATEERHAFIDWIAANPDAGDIIPKTGGARKIRWARSGTGKRGGIRIIYFHLVAIEVVLLVMVYTKAQHSDARPTDIRRSSS